MIFKDFICNENTRMESMHKLTQLLNDFIKNNPNLAFNKIEHIESVQWQVSAIVSFIENPNNTYENITLYNVYAIYSADNYYGISLVAAESVDEANKIIQDFRNNDKSNENDSYGYTDVSESDLLKELSSTSKGIILKNISYCG